jgi:O-methyltransferase involved in polyketide biosynthesis
MPVVSDSRDFSSISPSAKALLLVKARTSLPFARQAAELLWGAQAIVDAERESAGNPDAEVRRRHFEHRARSLDEALAHVGATRVLEIAAGLSFRGLAMASSRPDVVYMDTDLPEIAAIKADLVARLQPSALPLAGTLRVQALDALDDSAFRGAVRELPSGPIAIVHEGLLMYLDDAEKARLAASVRAALIERGGAWITADVYVRSSATVFRDERTKKFLAEHRVEERKFADWEAAEAFFVGSGLSIARRFSRTSDPWRVRETWILEPRA